MKPRTLAAIAVALAVPLGGAAGLPSAVGAQVATTLQWSACASEALAGFECATLVVPRDYADPSVGVFELAVARHRSTGTPEQRIGSLFFNPGGPGGSGLATLPQGWEALPPEVKDSFDLVTWDPRGVGESAPQVTCRQGRMTMPLTGSVDWAAAYDQMRTTTERAHTACLEDNADVLAYVGTNNVVRDLDALRQAVGDQQLTYWGMSYGTRIGYTYALMFPDNVRRLLLDGPVNPNGTLREFAATYAVSADSALGMFFQLYPQARERFDRSHAQLEVAPMPLPSGAVFSRWTLLQYMEQVARAEGSWPGMDNLLGIVDRAVSGAGADAEAAKAQLDEILKATPVSNVIMGAPAVVSAIDCIDYPDRPSAATQDATGRLLRRQAPIGAGLNYITLASQCSGMDVAPDPVPTSFVPADGSRILISASTRDAATPYAWAVSMARAFPGTRMLTYVGGQHVNYAVLGSTCVNDTVATFLIDGALPATDVACPNVGPQQQ